MKKITCRDMGGPCDHEMIAETAEEMGKLGAIHVRSTDDDAHKAIATQMDTMSEEDNKAWWDEFQKQWDTKSDE